MSLPLPFPRDFVIADHENLLRSSSCAFLTGLLEPLGDAGADNGPARAGFKFSSVAGRFQVQLTNLMETLSRMEPHYIRCIKPNDKNVYVAWRSVSYADSFSFVQAAA